MLPAFLSQGGPVIWLILLASAMALVVFVERVLHYHRAQINSMEFLNGVRNVLRRDNVVEAISICDATPGPVSEWLRSDDLVHALTICDATPGRVARLVKVAILNRDKGRDGVREALEETGLIEVPPLEAKLNLLATIAQIAPLMGLLGTVLGFIKVFGILQSKLSVPTMQDLS